MRSRKQGKPKWPIVALAGVLLVAALLEAVELLPAGVVHTLAKLLAGQAGVLLP